jgi:hypothetical protein
LCRQGVKIRAPSPPRRSQTPCHASRTCPQHPALPRSTVYVASDRREDLVTAWNEVAAVFSDHDAPSTLLGVAVLGYPDQLVEIEATAFVSPR